MYAANTYRIHTATDDDTDALRRLAERNSQQPLAGPVLIGELGGAGAAAISLSDGRVIADSGPRMGHLVANLRTRAVSIRATDSTPSLHDRMLAGLPAWYRAVSIATADATQESEKAEHDAELIFG